METPEIHTAHGHGSRHWLDMVVGLAALVTSMVSIAMAFQHGDTMERLVEAQSWPHVDLDSSNLVEGKLNVALSLRSSGSGPAKIKTLAISYAGMPVTSWPELLRACCASDPKAVNPELLRETDGRIVTGTPAGGVLLPDDNSTILSLPRSDANAVIWKRLDQQRNKLSFEVCYCSVFDDCYKSNLRRADPQRVKSCPKIENQWGSV